MTSAINLRRTSCARTAIALLLFVSLNLPFAASVAGAQDTLVFNRCAFEAERYVVCRVAPAEVETFIKSQTGAHPGAAFAAFIKSYFERRGCDYRVSEEAFRLNGVFFSLDARAFAAISCGGEPLKLKFAPDAMSIVGAEFKMSE